MESTELVAFLASVGVDASKFQESRPKLLARLASEWTWTYVFRNTLDAAFIGSVDGAPVTEAEGLALRQIASAHKNFRERLARKAPPEVLRKIGEDAVARIEREQSFPSERVGAALREAHAKIGMDDLGAILALKTKGVDLNQKDCDGLTPCAVAAQKGADKCLFALCKNDANPHVSDSMGNAPLHWACAAGNSKALSILLYHGANPNAANHSGVSPLMLALAKSNKALAQKMLDYGADLRMRDRKGNTVLHRAVMGGAADIAEFLIASGCPVEDSNNDGATPLGLGLRQPKMAFLFEKQRAERSAFRGR